MFPMQNAILITLIAGLCTSLGTLVIFFVKRTSLAALSLMMSFAAGAMIYISFLELMPLAIQKITESHSPNTAKLIAIISFAIGTLIAGVLDYLLPDHIGKKNTKDLSHIDSKTARKGFFIGLAIMLHNMPEGLAVLASSADSLSFGTTIAIAIAIHNIPEGMIIAMPIYSGTKNKLLAFSWTTLAGLAQPLGAILGVIFLKNYLFGTYLGIINSLVSGIMVYISLDELLPMAKEYGKEHYAITGTIIGILFIACVTIAF